MTSRRPRQWQGPAAWVAQHRNWVIAPLFVVVMFVPLPLVLKIVLAALLTVLWWGPVVYAAVSRFRAGYRGL